METITIDEIDFSSKSEVNEEITNNPIETKADTSNIQTFNFDELPVRTLEIENEPYFVGKDVAEILGYKNGSRDINRHVDEEDRMVQVLPQYQNGTLVSKTILINESGLYSMIFGSKLESAKRFKRWVTSEVE